MKISRYTLHDTWRSTWGSKQPTVMFAPFMQRFRADFEERSVALHVGVPLFAHELDVQVEVSESRASRRRNTDSCVLRQLSHLQRHRVTESQTEKNGTMNKTKNIRPKGGKGCMDYFTQSTTDE